MALLTSGGKLRVKGGKLRTGAAGDPCCCGDADCLSCAAMTLSVAATIPTACYNFVSGCDNETGKENVGTCIGWTGGTYNFSQTVTGTPILNESGVKIGCRWAFSASSSPFTIGKRCGHPFTPGGYDSPCQGGGGCFGGTCTDDTDFVSLGGTVSVTCRPDIGGFQWATDVTGGMTVGATINQSGNTSSSTMTTSAYADSSESEQYTEHQHCGECEDGSGGVCVIFGDQIPFVTSTTLGFTAPF